jgi:N-acetylglucosaminyldiphosphoundecaprenol N-acetyl-beta-D-mannosaminyltransferase
MSQTIEQIEGFIKSGTPHIVVTADSSGLVSAQKDPEFNEILQTADLVTPDSVGVIWAAKRKKEPVPERVSGVDIFAQICQKSAEHGYKLYFLGAAPGVAEVAAERCRLKFPGVNIVGARHGYFPADSDRLVAEEVALTKPDVLFVAMGIPRQEKFIKHTQDIIKAPVAIGVGGTLDVFSGTVKRAPKIIQKLKMEWLWRLIQNPKKISKAKNLPVFVRLVLRSRD